MSARASPTTASPGLRGERLPAAPLAAACVLAIAGLVVIRVGADASALERVLQLVLVVCFPLLALADFRAAVALAVFELALGGAGGKWTELGAGASGRHYIDAVVIVAAGWLVARDWRVRGRAALGRYGVHALAVAVVMFAVWTAVGLAEGNARADILADGNAMLFVAFVLVPIALASRGEAGWLRNCLFWACAANAVLTGVLIALSASSVVDLYPDLRTALLHDLDFGGAVGYMPNGAYRLYLASGLYLLVGLSLCTWRLLRDPREWWSWALFALLCFDVTATYTRGLWVGAALATVTVAVLGGRGWRRPLVLAAGAVALFVAAMGIGTLADYSVKDYVFNRAASIGSGPSSGSERTSGLDGAGSGSKEAEALLREPHTGRDRAGELSNKIKANQARVLRDEIRSRPLIGSGWGAIAERYRYGHIYSYELTYLNLLFKTGVLGFLIFMSLPLRLLLDSVRGRIGHLRLPPGIVRGELAVPLAILASILFIAATNPYLLASFGLAPILLCVAWLDDPRPHAGAPS